jgi:valyl-tRNA synthetase
MELSPLCLFTFLENPVCDNLPSMEDLPKAYNPKEVEERLYALWEERGYFKADPKSKKEPYTIVLPPPNVTGVLHMGHALVDTIQDILIRFKRMSGYEALWMPGTDHAGISTQTVVEKHLINTMGKRRKDFSREEFLGHVWQWKELNEKHILFQLKQLGCSCDWEKLRFTMDEGSNRSVRTVFKKMFDEGLIYRGDYLVNWDPVTQTALGDDEVEHEERDSFLWYFSYPLADGSGHLTIATTRPETMLGDTAVAVSPKDHRYSHLIGKEVLLPIMDRKIPIIADRYVDPEFGTGVVKMTPAHDPNDYQIGIAHNLEMINIMTPDGFVNENGGPYKGMKMAEAREAVAEKMDQLGLLKKKEPYTHRVGISYRSKAIIEPYLSKQWFVKMDGFKERLMNAVKEKSVKLVPENWENTYFHWIENLRDWCISRQLWWGHQIPIWYGKKGEILCHDGEEAPDEVKNNPEYWEQDPDVLDTWYSSALWPFSTMGWPENTDLLKKFYPGSTLVTGHDILFFWVARMIFMGEYVMGEVPFNDTFLHGLIYGKSYWRVKDGAADYVSQKERLEFDLGKTASKDIHSKWEKMSKSKGNVINPLEIIDVYGADAMRMALTASCTHARQIDLDRRRFEEYKNFANKMWNGARFVLMNLTLTPDELAAGIDMDTLDLEDKWILSVLNRTTKEMSDNLNNYHFDKAANRSYAFFWDDFCSYYLELTKPTLFGKTGSDADRLNKQRILCVVLTAAIRLLHPMAPFITEELFQKIKERFPLKAVESDPYTTDLTAALSTDACIIAPYPQVFNETHMDTQVESDFVEAAEFVQAIRNIRAEMQLPPKKSCDIYTSKPIPETHTTIIKALINIGTIAPDSKQQFPFFSKTTVHGITLTIPLPEELQAKEKERQAKEGEKLKAHIASLEGRLANKAFTEKAPKALVDKTLSELKAAREKLSTIK